MLNTYQFSSAKDLAESALLQNKLQELAIISPGFKAFKEAASEIVLINRDTWLRVEMDACKRGSVMGEKQRQAKSDKDLYPYWVYRGRMDRRERFEHKLLEGRVFRIGDPAGELCHPPNGWNCRCTTITVDSRYLKENNVQLTKGDDILDKKDVNGKYFIDKQFRYAPSKQILPNDGSYFEVVKSANNLGHDNFDLSKSV